MNSILKKCLFLVPGMQRLADMQRRICVLERELRLTRQAMFELLPQRNRADALKIWWNREFPGKPLDLVNPRSYNEKIQWIKLHGEDELLTRLADKFSVREWVASRIGEKHLVPILGVWNKASEIDFTSLPRQFVLKATHGSGWGSIVRNKKRTDLERIRRTAAQWLETNYALTGSFQMQYFKIKPRLIAEQYLENANGDLYDYKFWCFKGRCEYIQFLSGRKDELKMAFLDRNWRLMPFISNHTRNTNPPPAPDNIDEMIHLSEVLAKEFEYVRVDFYRLNDGSILFGEMTFTPANGVCRWDPPEWNQRLGDLFDVREGNRN